MQRAVYSLPRTARSSLNASIERTEIGAAPGTVTPVAAVDLGPLFEMAAIALVAGIGLIVAYAIGLRLYIGAVERRDRRDRGRGP